jgi:hypothetical protein
MPFRPEFDEVMSTIRKAAKACHLHCWRADEISRAGFVRQMILDDIEAADVVVADLTGRNANVFYETAIAHMKKDPHQVILLAQDDDDVPFDLRPLRYLKYSNNPSGRSHLRQQLSEFLQQGLQGPTGRLFETIEGKIQRTKRIVADCEALSHLGTTALRSLTIRSEAGLSCLAISSSEARNVSGEELVYRKLLIAERESVTRLIKQGAVFKAILAPRVEPLHKGLGAELSMPLGRNLLLRYQRLLKVLEGRAEYLSPARCQLAILPSGYIRSIIILGDDLSYEGIKAGVTGGFDLTTRVTDTAQIAARIRAFDGLFDDSAAYTLERYGNPKQRTAQAVRAAFLEGLRECYESFRAQHRLMSQATIPANSPG